MNLFERMLSWIRPRRAQPTEPPRAAPVAPVTAVHAPPAESVPPTSPEPVSPPEPEPDSPWKKPADTFGLDAADYLPISRDELRKSAQDRNLLSGPWLGRRDVIPPADDPRTRLIDRAMVTNGFITPEQLADIHAIGAEMDRARLTLATLEHQAAMVGEAAVQADRQARAELKARKKAEAAERRRRHSEDVARRKAEDIVFLGRGVSGRLGERAIRIDDLESAGLPVLSTPAELAAAMGITVSRLRWLAFHAEVATRTHYIQFAVPKKSGGERILSAPHRSMAEAQRWILDRIVARLAADPAAHGFLPGRSILTNAQPHVGRAIVVNLDLEGFFPSIGFPRVRKVFERLGYSPAVATILALICTECPRRTVMLNGTTYHVATGPRGLPQGACTSPGLSNQVAWRLDRRLTGLATKLGLTYTRYADDLTFSGEANFEGRVGYLMARVRHIAEAEGFRVNESKTRVQRRNTAQTVTGLVVNDRPGVARSEVRRIRAILHRARVEGLDRQNRANLPDFRAWLVGKIAFIRMARPEVGDRLLAELRAIEGDSRA
ncbi:MAG: reverse transcriptase domain-containing protein [Isosphaeraceae bacterium]